VKDPPSDTPVVTILFTVPVKVYTVPKVVVAETLSQ
jgi:hypothetical protein